MSYSNIKKKILIFIPAYNVEKKIYSVIERIPKSIFQNDNIKILIINDYSKDKTFEEISKATTNFDYSLKYIIRQLILIWGFKNMRFNML